MGKEQDVDYYNKGYSKYYDPGIQNVYNRIHMILEENIGPCDSILEIGCGIGVLSEQLLERYPEYVGFDFSSVAINRCERGHSSSFNLHHFLIYDAYDPWIYKTEDWGCMVATEVMEHLDDFRLLDNIPQGQLIIFSVPNFDDPAHVRVYYNEAFIKNRFKDHVVIKSIEKFKRDKSDDKYVFLVVGYKK